MSQPDFPTAQQVHENWELQKQELLREQALNLEQVYEDVAKFGAHGPKKVAQYKLDNWINTAPTLAVASAGLIAVGAVASPGLAMLGMMALGKVALDVIQKGQYNAAVDRYNQLREGLAGSSTPEDARKHLEAAVPEQSERSIPKLLGTIGAGAVVGFAAALASPAIGIAATTAIGVGAALVAAKGMGELFQQENGQTLVSKAQERVKSFAERLEDRRLAAQPTELDIQPQRPSGP